MGQGNRNIARLDPPPVVSPENLTQGVNGCGHCGIGYVVLEGDANGQRLVCLNCSTQQDLRLVTAVA